MGLHLWSYLGGGGGGALPGFTLLCSLVPRPLSPLQLGLGIWGYLYAGRGDVSFGEGKELVEMLKSGEALPAASILGSD